MTAVDCRRYKMFLVSFS